MANSLEGRAPFLSTALVDVALRLPEAQRMTGTQTKIALREAAAVLLPKAIVQRKKHGFILPMAKWLQQWLGRVGDLRDYFNLHRIKEFDAGCRGIFSGAGAGFGFDRTSAFFSHW